MTTENLPEVPKKETALEVYQATNGLNPWIDKIRAEVESFVPDVSTKKGREAIASIAYKVAKSKTALDNLGKELVAELKELPKKIDAERARVRTELDALRDQVRKPLTDWEAAEAEKESKKKQFIEDIKIYYHDAEILSSSGILAVINKLESIEITDGLEEYETEALHAKESTIKKLREMYSQKVAQEQQNAELEKLRAEAAAREQADKEVKMIRDAEERAIKAAEEKANAEKNAIEAKAKAEREASERRELELKLQAEKAEREKLEAQQREARAIENEKLRVKQEADKAEDERLKREKDKAHIGSINRSAKQCFIDGGMTEECAILAVTLIAKKQIKNVHIDY